MNPTRRQMIQSALVAAALPLAGGAAVSIQPAAASSAGGDRFRGLKIGVASYTFRKMSVAEAITATRRVGLRYISIKDFHLALNTSAQERQAVARKFRDAGITPLSCGVITMRNDEASVRNAFEYARDAGIPTIVCSPDPAALPLLDKFVKEFDIRLAIHNHGPGDQRFPTPESVYEKVKNLDARIGLCIDVGHTLRIGADPVESILKYRDRLHDVHLKDIDKPGARGSCVEAGRGILDLKGCLAALLQIRFAGLAAFEYEKDADDPVPGLAETVGYTCGVLNTLPA